MSQTLRTVLAKCAWTVLNVKYKLTAFDVHRIVGVTFKKTGALIKALKLFI